MRLENVLSITNVALLNEPSVSSFDSFAFELKEVKRGCLYVARDSNDIDEAILLGAYGVLFEKPIQIHDSEVAWLKSSDLEDTLKKLLRYFSVEKNLHVYLSDSVMVELAKQIITTADFRVIDSDIFEMTKDVYALENDTTVLLRECNKYSDVFVDAKEIDVHVKEPIEIIEQTLFETSFIYNNRFYERQLLSPFFIPYLEQLFQFLRNEIVEFRLRTFKPSKHFQSVFVNEFLETKEFGESQKVLIFEPSFDVMQHQVHFMKRQASWANIIYIIPSYRQKHIEENDNIFTYQLVEDIIGILKENSFHFALICEQNPDILEKANFKTKAQQLTLDF